MLAILVWAVIFLAVFGISILLMSKKHVSYSRNFVLAFYFFIMAVFTVFLYEIPVPKSIIVPFLVFLLSMVFHTKINSFPASEQLEKHTQLFDFNQKFIAVKFSEVIFQELMIYALIMILSSKGFSVLEITGIFSVLFPLLHIPIVFFQGKFGYLYVISSFAGALVLPFIIVNYGVAYSITLHWLFYPIARILLSTNYLSKILVDKPGKR